MNQTKRRFGVTQLIYFSLIILVLITIIFFGLKAIKKSALQKELINQDQNESISPEEYGQWKIFSDLELKYSLKYPQDWTIEKKSPTEINFYSPSRLKIKQENPNSIVPSIRLTIFHSFSDPTLNPKKLNLEDWVKLQNAEDNIKKININGLDAYEITNSDSARSVFLQRGEALYSIFDSSSGANIVQQQIINSFESN